MEPILVDDREPKGIEDLIYALGVPARRGRLDVGDYTFFDKSGGLILISRKGSDLMSSLFSGHMKDEFNKCINLVHSYGAGGKVIYLQEGVWANNWKGGVGHFVRQGPKSFGIRTKHQRTKASLPISTQISAQSAGVWFLSVPDQYDLAGTLVSLYERGQQGWPTTLHRGLKPQPLVKTSKKDPNYTKIQRLQGLWPRLSENLAKALIKEYTTIAHIVDVAVRNPAELENIKGIGEKLMINFEEAIS